MSSEFLQEDLVEEAEPEIVHWMEPRRVTLGPGAASAALAGAFALGVLATLGALALARLLDEDNEPVIRLRRI